MATTTTAHPSCLPTPGCSVDLNLATPPLSIEPSPKLDDHTRPQPSGGGGLPLPPMKDLLLVKAGQSDIAFSGLDLPRLALTADGKPFFPPGNGPPNLPTLERKLLDPAHQVESPFEPPRKITETKEEEEKREKKKKKILGGEGM